MLHNTLGCMSPWNKHSSPTVRSESKDSDVRRQRVRSTITETLVYDQSLESQDQIFHASKCCKSKTLALDLTKAFKSLPGFLMMSTHNMCHWWKLCLRGTSWLTTVYLNEQPSDTDAAKDYLLLLAEVTYETHQHLVNSLLVMA